MKEIAPNLMIFLLLFGVIAGYVILYSGKPVPVALLHLTSVAVVFPILSVSQFVQTLIWNEKARGTFLFLRSLPVSSGEVISTKLLVLLLATTTTYLLPVGLLTYSMARIGSSVSPLLAWTILWIWIMLLLLGLATAAAAIAFDQRRAVLLPYLVLALVGIVLKVAIDHYGPGLPAQLLKLQVHKWGVALAMFLICLAWRGVAHLFRTRDFVQLVE